MARRTRIYTVHLRPESPAPDREAVLIREGFAFWAGLFTFLWALRHRLWFWAIILLAVQVGIAWAIDTFALAPVMLVALGGALFLLVGFAAPDWRRAGLARRGLGAGRYHRGPRSRRGAQAVPDQGGVAAPRSRRRCDGLHGVIMRCVTPHPNPPPQGGREDHRLLARFFSLPLDGGGLGWGWGSVAHACP